VFSFSRSPRERGYDAVIETINDWIEQYAQSPFLAHVELERFRSPDPVAFSKVDLDPLALIYQQYLMHLKPPVVIKAAAAGDTLQWFLQKLHEKVDGVPSKLEIGRDNDDVATVVDMALNFPGASVLDQADDDDLMARIRQGDQ
jgi:hypothetical protein